MIISKETLELLIEKGEIKIEPFDRALHKSLAYSFTLGNMLSILKPVEFIDGGNRPDYEEKEIPEDGYILQPGDFVVGYTRENVTLNNKYVCLLSGRSTQAQLGLDVTQSSFLAERDTDNVFALEINNNTRIPIKIYAGMKIAKGIFLEVSA